MALLAALAGESILLLGPPGVAKSMVARRLKAAFREAKSFEYLMSRFSTPDELFGPVSITKLKDSDSYERATEGFLPTADVVFLDEIWKAGPAIQNTLLTMMNEKLFRNGKQEIRLPLKLLVAASNELPAKGEGLEALWDRFLIRLISRNIQQEETFRLMLTEEEDSPTLQESAKRTEETLEEALSEKELADFQAAARKVKLSKPLLEAITEVRKALQRVDLEDSDLARHIYVSDRRWKHIAHLLRTEAAALEQPQATAEMLLPMVHCLWNEPDEIPAVKGIVVRAIFAPIVKELEQLSAHVKADLRACRAKEALQKAIRENDHRDDHLLIADRFFYQIENHGTGHSYVFITDFKRMPNYDPKNAPTQGIIYTDPSNPKRRIVRLFDPDATSEIRQRGDAEHITLARDATHIYINGVRYLMRAKDRAHFNPEAGTVSPLFAAASSEPEGKPTTSMHYEEDMETVCAQLDETLLALARNFFLSASDRADAESYAKSLNKQIALTRVDIRRLLYNEN